MLRREDINIAGHITAANTATAKRVFQSVPGIGYATASYFLMLLGTPGIKPDRMIHRLLREATSHPSTNARADQLLQATAETLGAGSHELNHAIWRYQSTQAQRRRLLAASSLPTWHDTNADSALRTGTFDAS